MSNVEKDTREGNLVQFPVANSEEGIKRKDPVIVDEKFIHKLKNVTGEKKENLLTNHLVTVMDEYISKLDLEENTQYAITRSMLIHYEDVIAAQVLTFKQQYLEEQMQQISESIED